MCQESGGEKLIIGTIPGHKTLAQNLTDFDKIYAPPICAQVARIDQWEGVEKALIANASKWHKKCRLKFNNQNIQRQKKKAQKRAFETNTEQSNNKKTKSGNEYVTVETFNWPF